MRKDKPIFYFLGPAEKQDIGPVTGMREGPSFENAPTVGAFFFIQLPERRMIFEGTIVAVN